MKKVWFVVGIIIIVFILVFAIVYENNLKEDTLTKTALFDMIDDVDNILLSSITENGIKTISDEGKIEFVMLYIFKNVDEYNDSIVDYNSYDFLSYDEFATNENWYFGKMKVDDFEEVLKKFFTNYDLAMTEIEESEDGYVLLTIKPCEWITYDEKEIIDIKKDDEIYQVLVRYNRCLGQTENTFYVQYDFTKNTSLKIEGVTVYDSVIN